MKQQGKGRYHITLHCNPIIKPCSSNLSMSHQGESLLQEFQHFLERLQSKINKGLNNNLIITNIKKAIEIHPNARDVKKKILIMFEIWEKIEQVPIAFVVKEEVEELKGIEIVQKKVDLSGIPKLVQEYNIKYLNSFYYC
jgi:hypothetical protein